MPGVTVQVGSGFTNVSIYQERCLQVLGIKILIEVQTSFS